MRLGAAVGPASALRAQRPSLQAGLLSAQHHGHMHKHFPSESCPKSGMFLPFSDRTWIVQVTLVDLMRVCYGAKGVLRELHGCRWAGYVRLLPAPPGSLVAAVCSDGPPASDLLLFRQASQNLIFYSDIVQRTCLHGPSHPPVPYTTVLRSCSAC